MLDKICDRLLRNHQWYDLYEDNYLSDKLDPSHLRSWARMGLTPRYHDHMLDQIV